MRDAPGQLNLYVLASDLLVVRETRQSRVA